VVNMPFSIRITAACCQLQNTLFRQSLISARILTVHQTTRGKRTTKPAPWWVKKKINPKMYNEEISRENKEFLTSYLEDQYPLEKLQKSPLRDEKWERQEWTTKSMRTGVLAVKIGSIPQWTKDGRRFHTTMLQVLDNHVIRYSPPEKFSKSAGFKSKWSSRTGSVVVGALSCSPEQFSPQYNALFKEAGLPPKRRLTRFLVTPDAAIQAGTPLHATHFKVGDYVDVQAKTIGHGFQGVVKRWGFKGGPASHGTTKWHRRPGTIGSGRTGKVWKGKKLPGYMGNKWRFLKGLKVWRINTKYNVLYVNGPIIPGPMHAYTRVHDTVLPKKRLKMKEHPPLMPTFYPDEDSTEPLAEDIFDDDVFQFKDSTITLEDSK